ncbi:hypothetical protein N781_02255 [Pontibacillus halophilus JSM 076056 = DSM 19796]|uniref:Uncharacterized protein n=1 Tax=Pontibacillus halophilus JSM 076056 = DSM 19796 TaxID=1385510 RepID=A0A0A5IDX8_9BACI|nr:hypothetical protein [Pontibacillus halophilus]KGX94012.1 hypothetical protein N781_02255 [Pontibacillus halophilus JSM 076056 = DSM 19796]
MAEPTQIKEERFTTALEQLKQSPPFAKAKYQTDVYQEANRLLQTKAGLELLYQYADQYDESGVFQDGPWEKAEKLQPPLVAGSLQAKGLPMIIEVLSELRMLALAKDKYSHPVVTPSMAEEFLNEVMVLNLDLLFPNASESSRIEKRENLHLSQQLLQFIIKYLSPKAIVTTLVKEIQRLTAQRPIMINRTVSMIAMAKELLASGDESYEAETLKEYISAIEGPSLLSRQYPQVQRYRIQLKDLSKQELISESKSFATSMRHTGLVAPQHATLVRFLNRHAPEVLPFALGLNSKGKANLEEHAELVGQVIKTAIYPATKQSIYGLALMLERGVLSSAPVTPGLRRLIELDIRADVRNTLFQAAHQGDGLTANTLLLSGVINVLGQPLGVGQGMNPTCQAARGISLWAQHAPGMLLELIPRAARDGDLDFTFEGVQIHSKDLSGGLAPELHKELDPVSLVLVPHLDRIYSEMMTRVSLRGEDGHRWVNPSFYGSWVQRGFSTAIDPITGNIVDYAGFVRLFYATHHPEYNDDYELIYPNPVGIFITNVHGKMLGFHAVSIQRIAKFNEQYRIYFYNPNNDSSQNWGQGIEPTVLGHGELEGECSLPFHEFVSRLYAYHYNPYEQGESYAVEDEHVHQVQQLAKASWGQEYTWM